MSNDIQTGISRYYGLDGDRIKSEIEKYLINGDVNAVSHFSKQLTSTLAEIEKKVINKGGDVKYCSGDNIFFSADFSPSDCEELLNLFLSQTGLTASIGIGNTSTEVYLALRLAKSTGGGKIISYQNGRPLPLEHIQLQENALVTTSHP
jgi:hypothetical protein